MFLFQKTTLTFLKTPPNWGASSARKQMSVVSEWKHGDAGTAAGQGATLPRQHAAGVESTLQHQSRF